VKAVDELETEGDQQGDEQQQEGEIGGDLHTGRPHIGHDAVADEEQRGTDDTHE